MGGETPGAKRAGQQKNKKTRLTHLDDKKTDKYYASKQKSVINNTPADSRGGIGAVPQPIKTASVAADERSADKKYYGNRPAPSALPVARHLQRAAEAKPRSSVMQAVSSLTIRTALEVNPVMDEVVRRLQNGDTDVIVNVSPTAIKRARTKLDSLTTRALITEEQKFSVRFSALAEAEEPQSPPLLQQLGEPPVPTETVRTEDEQVDIDSILSGDSPLDDGPSTEVQDVQEVDDVDELTPQDGPTTEPTTELSADLDALLGGADPLAEAADEAVPTAEAPAEEEPLDAVDENDMESTPEDSAATETEDDDVDPISDEDE